MAKTDEQEQPVGAGSLPNIPTPPPAPQPPAPPMGGVGVYSPDRAAGWGDRMRGQSEAWQAGHGDTGNTNNFPQTTMRTAPAQRGGVPWQDQAKGQIGGIFSGIGEQARGIAQQVIQGGISGVGKSMVQSEVGQARGMMNRFASVGNTLAGLGKLAWGGAGAAGSAQESFNAANRRALMAGGNYTPGTMQDSVPGSATSPYTPSGQDTGLPGGQNGPYDKVMPGDATGRGAGTIPKDNMAFNKDNMSYSGGGQLSARDAADVAMKSKTIGAIRMAGPDGVVRTYETAKDMGDAFGLTGAPSGQQAGGQYWSPSAGQAGSIPEAAGFNPAAPRQLQMGTGTANEVSRRDVAYRNSLTYNPDGSRRDFTGWPATGDVNDRMSGQDIANTGREVSQKGGVRLPSGYVTPNRITHIGADTRYGDNLRAYSDAQRTDAQRQGNMLQYGASMAGHQVTADTSGARLKSEEERAKADTAQRGRGDVLQYAGTLATAEAGKEKAGMAASGKRDYTKQDITNAEKAFNDAILTGQMTKEEKQQRLQAMFPEFYGESSLPGENVVQSQGKAKPRRASNGKWYYPNPDGSIGQEAKNYKP